MIKLFKKDKVILFLIVIFFSIVYSIAVLIRHWNFQSFGFDLGIFDQVVWRFSRLQMPYSSIKGFNFLGDHLVFSLALLSPLYWLFPKAETLLLVQVVIAVTSLIPIFLLTKRKTNSLWLAMVISSGYMLFFGMQRALLFDFHEIVLAAALLAWLFYFIDTGRWNWYWVVFFVALGLKEDVSILLFALGIYIFLFYRSQFKVALVSCLISVIYFFLATKIIIPYFNPEGFFLHRSFGPRQLWLWLTILFDHPLKRQTLFWSFFSFAFLPLLSWQSLVLPLAHFLEHFIDPKFIGRFGLELHYRVTLAPILAIGTIWAISGFNQRFKWLSGLILLTVMVVAQYQLHLPLNNLFKKSFYQQQNWMIDNYQLIRQIPSDASVATQNNLIPHLSARDKIYLFGVTSKKFSPDLTVCGKESCPWLETFEAEYLLVDLQPNQPLNNFWDHNVDEVNEAVMNLLKTGEYKIYKKINDVYLLKKFI